MNKAIFLDRDGTINIDYGYVGSVDKFEFIPGVIETLKILSDYGYLLIVISNQSGIGRGYYTEDDANEVFEYMCLKLKENGVNIAKYYYCPHTSEDKCECRKPKTKLFYDAIKELNIDTNNSYAVGDKERDLSICDETNIKGFLISNEKSNKYNTVQSINDILKFIIKELNEKK